ncbi:lipoprotein [Streptomyces sp. AS58]|uniref:DUF4232 domain-containing protein n=1 Tax=Streptomyces cadmiisoli TaxID=2184053 RepID=A0A2Z4IU21_9ACTN|nr:MULTISPECIES: DUF4232 domain-containing protein [Streptomyces]AWW36254.1 DUF4232 domain-containing protein [Streptomyces cadmiisoli]KOV72111.1 lipoprotein [Streptomyces sp. AS58]
MTHASPSAHPSPAGHRALLLAGGLVALSLLTGCGGADGTTSGRPQPGTAAPPAQAPRQPGAGTSAADPAASGPPSDASASTSPEAAPGTRCHTWELRASVGRNNPGAGQRNFPVVLTNASSRVCTLYGHPGAAFLDAAGEQLGPDPRRVPDSPVTVRLAPGESAWAGLSYASPEISGARTAAPAALLVTPPDERDPLTVRWTGEEVPVSGGESEVSVTVFQPGTGA